MRISDWSSDVCSSDLAARYGLTQADVQQLIATVVGGQPVAQTIEGRERYPVVVRYPRAQRDSIAELARLPLVAPNGVQLTLGQVVERSEEHTSELQSLMRLSYAVFCLKNKKKAKI